MRVRSQKDWSAHVDAVLRSQHYTRLAEGLAGAPLEKALQQITADIMHICRREGLSWDKLLQQSATQCDLEERGSLKVAS